MIAWLWVTVVATLALLAWMGHRAGGTAVTAVPGGECNHVLSPIDDHPNGQRWLYECIDCGQVMWVGRDGITDTGGTPT